MRSTQAGNNALGWWQRDDTPHVLQPGDVLRARDAEDGDEWALVRVVGLHTVQEVEEAVITPLAFGPNLSAPISGEGGILRAYDVLGADEVAELLPEPEPEPRGPSADIVAAKARLARERAEA